MKTHWSIQPALTSKAKHRYTILFGTLQKDWTPKQFAPNTWTKSNIGADNEQTLFKIMGESDPECIYVDYNDLHIRL